MEVHSAGAEGKIHAARASSEGRKNMHRKSRALFLIAAALLLLTAAFADTAKAQEAGTWEELKAALANGGSVTLIDDVEGSTPLRVADGDAELDLNNHTMTYTGDGPLFEPEGTFR